MKKEYSALEYTLCFIGVMVTAKDVADYTPLWQLAYLIGGGAVGLAFFGALYLTCDHILQVDKKALRILAFIAVFIVCVVIGRKL